MRKSILSVSLDPNIVVPKYGNAQVRQLEYALYFDKYVILILSRRPFHLGSEPQSYSKGNLFAWATRSRNQFTMVIMGLFQGLVLARKYHVKVVTSQDPYLTGLIAWFISKFWGKKFVLQLHSTFFLVNYHPPISWLDQIKRNLVMWQVSQADAVRVVNPDVSEILAQKYPNKLIKYIPVKVEVNKFYRTIAPLTKITRFITVGRLAAEKNHQLLINTFAKLHKLYPQARLTIVGDGPLSQTLDKQIKSLGLTQVVKLFGAATPEQIRKLYSNHHAFVLSSLYEGMALVLIEAAAAGLPIISTKVGAAESLFMKDRAALLVNTHSSTDLLAVLTKLIENPSLGNKLAIQAQSIVMNKFAQANQVGDWVNLLEQV